MLKYGLQKLPVLFSALVINYFKLDIKNSISALKSLVEYKLALDELGCTDSMEDIDRRLTEQKSILADIAAKLWNKWLVTGLCSLKLKIRSEMNQYVTAMKLVGDVDLSEYPDLRMAVQSTAKGLTQFLPCWP